MIVELEKELQTLSLEHDVLKGVDLKVVDAPVYACVDVNEHGNKFIGVNQEVLDESMPFEVMHSDLTERLQLRGLDVPSDWTKKEYLLFYLYHECAHIVLDHGTDAMGAFDGLNMFFNTQEEIMAAMDEYMNHKDEVEADLWAYKRVLRRNR